MRPETWASVVALLVCTGGTLWTEWRLQRHAHESAAVVTRQLRAQREIVEGLSANVTRLGNRLVALASCSAPISPSLAPQDEPDDGSAGNRAPPTSDALEVVDEASAAAAVRAEDVLERAIAAGRWSVNDERALLDDLGRMTAQSRNDVMTRRALAVNEGKLRFDPVVRP